MRLIIEVDGMTELEAEMLLSELTNYAIKVEGAQVRSVWVEE